jgi:ketosteroid isomerase-like protein
MIKESTPPDLVKLMRDAFEASSRHDLDTLMGFFAPDAVWDISEGALGTFVGVAAIRSLVADWWGTWGEHVIEEDEIVDLGHGVVFASVREDGRLIGSERHVEQRRGWVYLWIEDSAERATVYLDIDEARAAAERVAEERAQADV